MNRLEVHRQSCFYELYAGNLLDHGNVSMLTEIRGDVSADKKVAWQNLHKQYNSCFDRYLDDVSTMIPFRNFDVNLDINKIIADTAYSIVMETYVNRPDAITFTEKTLRALQVPRPFLLMGSTGSIEYLRSLGFDVFDKFIDHSYDILDTAENAMPRLIAIIDQLKYLCQQPITDHMIKEWRLIHSHNMALLKLMNDNFSENYLVVDALADYLARII
jgi:hypothetical protein